MNYRKISLTARLKIIRILNQELEKPELTQIEILAMEDLLFKLRTPCKIQTSPSVTSTLAGSALSNRSSEKRRTSVKVARAAGKILVEQKELRERRKARYH